MLQQYLSNEAVQRKNQSNESFLVSFNVFVNLSQTPLDPVPSDQNQESESLTYASLQERFRQIRENFKNRKQLNSNNGYVLVFI